MRGHRTLLMVALATAMAMQGVSGVAAAAARLAPAPVAPTHVVSVSGAGVVTYPAFSPDVTRYGITTTAATGGTVTVTGSTSDPAGRVLVNGRPAAGGSRTVSGLTPGDEIAVFIEDAAGTARHSFIYLPADFPVLERTTPDPAHGSLQPGAVLLTLSQWVRPVPPDLDFFETAVDVNGVPLFARRTPRSMDLNRQPNGQFTVFRGPATSGAAGEDLVVLDDQMEPIASRRTVGLVNTDGHDAILLPDGTLWLMAYEPNTSTGKTDAVIQEIKPNGTVGFRWSSEGHETDAVRNIADYAHINSFQLMQDGDLVVSFRHFSSVWKIATSAHDDFETGDVVWKLGGRDSDFDFEAGDDGPCAQHTARELPNGDILMFDNGSASLTTSWCVDQDDPLGPPVQRVQTRVIAYNLSFDPDGSPSTATIASSYAPPNRFAVFAGSAQRLGNGNTLVGWAEETQAMTTEIDAAGTKLWELRDPTVDEPGGYPYFTYRAAKAVVPDAFDPSVSVTVPAEAASYVEGSVVPTGLGCTDRGGSSLQTCSGPTTLDTGAPGPHTVTFSATDGAGRVTTVTRTYRVLAATGVDASIRKAGSRRWVGEGSVGTAKAQRVRATLARAGGTAKVLVRLRNDGALPAGLTVTVDQHGKGFRVAGPGARDGTSPVLQPGQSWLLRLTVVRRASARPGDHVVVTLRAATQQVPLRSDGVSVRVAAKRS